MDFWIGCKLVHPSVTMVQILRAVGLMAAIIARVLSDDMPTMTSKNVTPTLEDYYLYVFGDSVSTTYSKFQNNLSPFTNGIKSGIIYRGR